MTSSQKSLWDPPNHNAPPKVEALPLARKSDPVSSHIAALSARYKAGSHKALLVEALERIGSGTSKELALACDPPIDRHAAAKRCANLKADGVVEVCGHRDGTQEEVLRLKGITNGENETVTRAEGSEPERAPA